MTLLDLLTAMVFVVPYSSAFAEAKIHHGGFRNYFLAFIAGSVLAICFVWLDYKKNRWFFKLMDGRQFKDSFFVIVPILSVFLLICGAVLGGLLTSRLLALIS